MEKPLYQDHQIEIKINSSPEGHLLGIRKSTREAYSYFYIARGGLKDFALAERGKLEATLDSYNPLIKACANRGGMSTKDVHIAFLQAFIEDEKRIAEGVKNLRL